VASVRSCQKLPPCLIELMPAGSKADLLLAKAEPISDSGSASGITCLRHCCALAAEERSDNMRETTLQTPRSVKKEREELCIQVSK